MHFRDFPAGPVDEVCLTIQTVQFLTLVREWNPHIRPNPEHEPHEKPSQLTVNENFKNGPGQKEKKNSEPEMEGTAILTDAIAKEEVFQTALCLLFSCPTEFSQTHSPFTALSDPQRVTQNPSPVRCSLSEK